MDDKQSLSHTKREGNYHLIWISKYRKKELYGGVRKYPGPCFKDFASQKESPIFEWPMEAKKEVADFDLPIAVDILNALEVSSDVEDEIIFRTIKPRNRLILELMARGGMNIIVPSILPHHMV